MANRLRRALDPDEAAITVVDRDDAHLYQPGCCSSRSAWPTRTACCGRAIASCTATSGSPSAEIDRVDTAANVVHLGDGGESVRRPDRRLGRRLVPEETEGMTGAGWQETVFDFYTRAGATRLASALQQFEGGRLVVNFVDLPIKCPVAPLEFAFLADWFLAERGIRDRSEIVFVTPLDGAFTKPVASRTLSGLLAEKHVALVTEFATGEVDGAAGVLRSYDDREEPFDLLVTVPLHAGAAFVDRSPGPGDDTGFVRADPHTLRAVAAPNVFAIGDATSLPTSKAGSVTHFEADTLTANVLRHLRGEGARGRVRRPRQLLHRDRLRQGAPDRLLVRRRAAAGPLPVRPRRPPAPEGVAREPPRQAALPVGLLARAAPGPRRAGHLAAASPPPREGADMSTATIAGTAVDLDAEGFMTDPSQWTDAIARSLAREAGIEPLTDRHWQVVRFMRETYLRDGEAPTIRTLGKRSGVPIKEIYQLFPKGPAKLAARIGGIPKPHGCI